MVMQVRRVVTGHDEKGTSIIATDEVLSAKSRGQGHNIEGVEMWTTDRMPVNNAPSDDARQRSGLVKRDEDPHMNFIGSGGGSVIRIIEWEPGHSRFTHRDRDARLYRHTLGRDRPGGRQRRDDDAEDGRHADPARRYATLG